ncbi:Uncharacterized protein PCOAH_00045370 [Plasmodium coatneyi]|uniref:Uncharacterized protein n=1 Tax=Plasmodium coatneyi TaxID=208452 RepID=A0A1B1E5P2_9APIC|nr:Uncharacterized protein PCOAH_00045370 [Plasmodium coatneyi]ANQ10321.1 Uncharacterized protein PCOAH_00045370 [Plasmodium coatneyi]
MNQKKKKKAKPPINLATLEDKINILNFMKDDFEKILDKENEIHDIVTKQHNNKEENTLNEKEKIDIILSELVVSCEEKKNQLNKYIKTASEIINQNNDIIEKEKEEIENLICEKNQEINSMQEKIDLAKRFYDDVNNAVVQLFNNLDLFLKNKINVELNIDHMEKISKAEKKMGNKPKQEDTQQWDEQVKRQNEGEDKFLQQLYHSMDEYEKKMSIIKSFMKENELDHLTKMLLTEKRSDAGVPAQLPHIPQIDENNINGEDPSGSGDPHSTESKQVKYEDTNMSETGQSELADDASDEVVSGEGEMEEEEESENSDDMDDDDEDDDDEEEDEESLDDDTDAEEDESLDDNTEEQDEEDDVEDGVNDDNEGGSNADDTSTENTQRKKFNTPAESEDNFSGSQQGEREVREGTPYGHTDKKTSGKIKILNDAETTIKSFSSDVYKKILSDNMNALMDKIKKIDYDYVSYFEEKLKS